MTETTSVFVTSHLVVGDEPGLIGAPARQVHTAEDAVEALRDGDGAVLPAGNFDEAERALALMTGDPVYAHEQVEYAQRLAERDDPLAL